MDKALEDILNYIFGEIEASLGVWVSNKDMLNYEEKKKYTKENIKPIIKSYASQKIDEVVGEDEGYIEATSVKDLQDETYSRERKIRNKLRAEQRQKKKEILK